MPLGDRIASLRKEKKLSQEALGELVGVSRQAVSKWESNKALPDIQNCIAMSRHWVSAWLSSWNWKQKNRSLQPS